MSIPGELLGHMKAMREKIWPERGADEKLEALRENVRHLLIVVSDLQERISKLEIHQHGQNGQLLAPMGGPVMDKPRSFYVPMNLRDKE